MNNKVKDVDTKNRTNYFVSVIINIENFNANNVKIDEKPYNNILIYYTRCVTIKDLKSVKINSGSPLYLIYSKVNGYFEEINKSKHLTLVPTNESKEKIKTYEELWSEIKELVRESVTKSSDHYDEKYMKVKFNLDYELLLKKTTEIGNSC